MSRQRLSVLVLIAFCGLIGLDAIDRFAPQFYLRATNSLADAIVRAGRKTPANPDLIFLAIDSDSVGLEEEADIQNLYGLTNQNSIEARALRLMSQRWPWPREVYALILERLVHAGAKVVMFDLTFPTSTAGDEPFRLALEKFRDRVVIGSNFISANTRGLTTSNASHTRPPDSLIPQTAPMDDRVAFTNFWPDADEVVRHAQYRVAFEQVQGLEPMADSERFLALSARGLTKAGFAKAVPAGIRPLEFRFTAPPGEGFPPHSIFEIFVPEYWQRNYQNGDFFRNKLVIVGAEGNWQHDEHATPFGLMPGPELHLNAINAALNHEFIAEPTHDLSLTLALVGAAVAIALSLGIRSPWLRLLALLVANAAAVWATLLTYNHLALQLPCLPFLAEISFTALFGMVSDFTSERLEKKRVRHTLEKYVSTNVVRELLDNPAAFQQALGGVVKPASILFSDIRGFSSVSAQTKPDALILQLNEYLGAMVECVFRYRGTLDKFIGDAVMAVWGNVQSEGVRNDAANAVRAALAMREELARLNADWRMRGLPELRVGIAINQGDVIVGNVGSPRRMEFTVIGDAVNMSWKLQELTKEVGSGLIVSKTVAALITEFFELQELGPSKIEGFSDHVETFAVLHPISVAEAPEGSAFQLH